MTNQQFNKKATEILTSYGAESRGDRFHDYTIETCFGRLLIWPVSDNGVMIFMRFLDIEQFDMQGFQKAFGIYENINPRSLKWNIHTGPNGCLELLEQRLKTLSQIIKIKTV